MTLRMIRVGALAVSLALGAGVVVAGQPTARACGGYMPRPQSAQTLVRRAAEQHVRSVFPAARDLSVELGTIQANQATVTVRFTLPGVGARVRTLDLVREADTQAFEPRWAVTSMRRTFAAR